MNEISYINTLKEQESNILATIKALQEAVDEKTIPDTKIYDQRELSLAITNIQQGFMWANRAIARTQENIEYPQ
jgi:hypothetical protein